MKNILYFNLLILIACLPGVAECQSPTIYSTTRTLEKPHGEDVFIRLFGSNGDLLVHNRNMLTSTSAFIARKAPYFSAAQRYEIPMQVNMYGMMSYKVLDMVVVGDMCFFCGRKHYGVGIEYTLDGIPYTVYEDMGFLGQVSLNHITDSPSGTANYRLTDIPGSKEVTRIDAKVDPAITPDTMLALVGTSTAGQSCLAFVNAGNNLSSWNFSMRVSNDVTETFTDIVFTETYVTATSRYTGSHYLFGMRSAMIDDVFANNYYNDLDMANTFNTSTMVNIITNINTTRHDDDVIIRLSPVPGTDEVNVGYESFAPSLIGLREYHTTLFLMDVYMPGQSFILDLQDVLPGVNEHEAFVDMLTMKERGEVALLYRSKTGQTPRSAVQLASWPPTGPINGYTAPSDEELTSIDKHGSDLLWAAGHRPQHQDSVVLFHQNLAYPDLSCYSQMFPMAVKLAEMVKPDTEDSGLVEVVVPSITTNTWQRLEAVPNWMKLRCLSRERNTDDSEDGDETDDVLE